MEETELDEYNLSTNTRKQSLKVSYVLEGNGADLLGSYDLLTVQFLINKLISLLQLIEFIEVESIVCHRFKFLIVRHRFELLLDAEEPACNGRCR